MVKTKIQLGMRDPKAYEKNKTVAKQEEQINVPLLINLMNWDGSDLKILDYGCGAGSVAFEYLLPIAEKTNSHITGIDISPEMIEFAKSKYTTPRINFCTGNFMNSELTENNELANAESFDKIFAINVIHFIKNYRKIFKIFHKSLKPTGELGFTVVTKSFLFEMFKAILKHPKWSKYAPGLENWILDFHYPDKIPADCIKSALIDAEFHIDCLKALDKVYTGTLESQLALYISVCPFLSKIPPGEMPEFENYVKDLMGEIHDIDHTKNPIEVTYKYQILVCLAHKT